MRGFNGFRKSSREENIFPWAYQVPKPHHHETLEGRSSHHSRRSAGSPFTIRRKALFLAVNFAEEMQGCPRQIWHCSITKPTKNTETFIVKLKNQKYQNHHNTVLFTKKPTNKKRLFPFTEEAKLLLQEDTFLESAWWVGWRVWLWRFPRKMFFSGFKLPKL